MTPNTRAALLALSAFGIFATHDVIVKVLGSTYAPFQIVFFSVLFSFPLVTMIQMRDASLSNLRPRHPWWTALRTAAAVITAISAFYTFSVLPLTEAYALIFAAPLLITVLAIPILGEAVRWRRGLAVIVGLGGVLVVLRPGVTDLSVGHVSGLICAFSGALASVIVRKIGREERTVVLLLYPMITNFVLMGALMPVVYVPMPLQDMAGMGAMALLAIIASTLLIMAYRKGDAAIVAPMQYSQILWAAGYGLIFFAETPDLWTLVGTTIIVASGLYIVLREGQSPSSKQPVLKSKSRPDTSTTPRVSALYDALRWGKKSSR
ncbi:MAG: DMT family transporter [Pseudomonadota bacterium]